MKTHVATGLSATVLVLVGCAGAGGPQTALVQILGDSNGVGRFEPATLVVPVGTEVRWRSEDAHLHTVTTEDTLVAGVAAVPEGAVPWDSGSFWPGDTFVHQFDVEGTYLYWCNFHRDEQMVGTIEVVGP